MTRIRALALLVLLCGCGDDDGSGPDERQFEGTWTGSYTNSLTPELDLEAVLDLSQNDDEVTGTLITSSERSADVSGTVSGDQVELTFTYNDGCDGTASSTANLVDETVPPTLEGTYSSEDCLGETSGTYDLEKDE